jgi:3-phenylpropionate/trans-cinnamate dioxygenase ferredoxin reductase component
MKKYPYIIVGAGVAADMAIKGIRRIDKQNEIALFGREPHPPYDRPPLSKELWKGKAEDIIWRALNTHKLEVYYDREIVSVDPIHKTIADQFGETYQYDALLMATGGSPRKLPFGEGLIHYLHDLDDFKRIQKVVEHAEHIAVIGGGFVGSEMASVLREHGKKVSMFFPEKGIGAHVFPSELSQLITEAYLEKGVEVFSGENVIDVNNEGEGVVLITNTDRQIEVDAVIAGIGLLPNIELAKKAGVNINRGIVVNEKLRTNYPDIYAAGDVAEFTQILLGKQLHVEHEDNARVMGKQAGRNMAGADETFDHLSYFYSDMFDMSYLAVGEVSSKLETYIDWREPFKKAVVYYLDGGRVRGVLLWNVANAVQEAKALIANPGPFTKDDLKDKIEVA